MATILVVEDEPQVRGFLVLVLIAEHHVVQAIEPAQAIKLARLKRPDLILLDLNLQGHHDGLEVCRTLRREADPVLAQVPIVMLTGETTQADRQAAWQAGVTDCLNKPFGPSSLLSMITTLLARRE